MPEPREVDTAAMTPVYGKFIRKDSPLVGGDPVLKPLPEDVLKSLYDGIADGNMPDVDEDEPEEDDDACVNSLLTLFKMLLRVILKLK